jgi:hypothetical protein
VQEIQTYLELKAGAHLFGVNLDDGFIMSSAPNPRDTLGTLLGMRNPGGGNANPLSEPNAYAGVFNVIVPEDGIYPIRLLWWQGGGGVNIEFMTIDKHTGVETMVNDPNRFAPHQANPPPFEFPYNSIVAYSDYNGPVRPWVKFSVYPLSSLWQNQHQQGGPGPILVKVAGGNPADIANDVPTIRPFGDAVGAIVADLGTGSVGMILNGQSVTPTVTSLPGSSDKLVTYTPPQPLDPSQTHTAGLVYAGSTNYWTFNVITNVALQSDVAIAADRLDTSKVGFRVKVAQAASGQPNTVARAEAQLSGTPASVAIPGPQPDGSYIVPGIINWNVSKNPGNTASEIGNFQPAMNGMADEPVPGIPGTGLSGAARFENISAEIFAYLDLPAGYQKFGVNGDDGWKVQIGTPGQTNGPILFSVDRGAGARDIPFAFITPQAGLYPVRLVWYQGGGGGNLEFFTYGPDNSKIPVNDRNNPLAVKAYYEVQTSLPDPQITGISISGSTITISWTGGGTLETASSLPADSWTSTGNNSGSFSTTASASQTYFRVKR